MILQIDDQAIEFIEGIESVIDLYDGFISDIWGVLHDGVRLYPGVQDCLQQIKKNQKKIILLSNSARLATEVKKQINRLGLPEKLYDHILSSGELAREVFQTGSDERIADLGKKYYLLGPEKYKLVDGLGLKKTDVLSQADFLLAVGVTGNPSTTVDAEPILQKAAARNLTMVCANPDVHVVRDGVKGIGSGALAKYYEMLNGEVIYFGKPHQQIYLKCLDLLDVNTSRIVAVGDSLKTDIAGASTNGLDSILVASGIHAQDLMTLPNDVSALPKMLKNDRFFPTYIAKGMFW